MAYQDRYGSTDLRTGREDNLSIGWDYNDNPDDRAQRVAQFLFIPDMQASDHYHIPLTIDQARTLRDWLNEYLKDKGVET